MLDFIGKTRITETRNTALVTNSKEAQMNETLPGMTPDEFRRMTENGATAWAGVDPADLRAGNFAAQAPAALTNLECPPDPDTVDRAVELGHRQAHAANGRAIVKRLYNDPADSISLVSVGEWIEYAAQLLALNEKPTFLVGELPADFFGDEKGQQANGSPEQNCKYCGGTGVDGDCGDDGRSIDVACSCMNSAPLPLPVQAELPADILLRAIQRLNQNTYALTKNECIDELRNLWALVKEQPAPAAQDLEGLAHQIYSAAQLAPGEGVTDAVDRIVALLGAAAQEPLTPDMFWDASDPERYGDDIEEIIADYGPGDTVKIDCAKRLPRIRVFVVGDEGDYEVLGGITGATK